MSWQFAQSMNIGRRAEQQDSVSVLEDPARHASLLVLADGMGGQRDGSMASQSVIDVAREVFWARDELDPPRLLSEICQGAHRRINEHDNEGGQGASGSTCTLLYLNDAEAWFGHIGDSRLYHFHNGELIYRTVDHSVAQLMIDNGQLDEETARASKLRNQLYAHLGGKQDPELNIAASAVDPGDLLVLCSDGLWERIDAREMHDTLHDGDLRQGVEHLVELALERNGETSDNISLVVARSSMKPANKSGGAVTSMLARIRNWFS